MSSYIISYRTQENIGLEKRTTDCEWVSENAMNGNYSTHNWRVDLSTIEGYEVVAPLASLVEGAVAVSAVGFKYTDTTPGAWCSVSIDSCFGADLTGGGSISYSSPGSGAPLGNVVVWGTTGVVEIVVILYHGV